MPVTPAAGFFHCLSAAGSHNLDNVFCFNIRSFLLLSLFRTLLVPLILEENHVARLLTMIFVHLVKDNQTARVLAMIFC